MDPVNHSHVLLEDAPAPPAIPPSACPADRMPHRRRNKICVWIIAVGALNFLIYTATYSALGGDAHNGEVQKIVAADGSMRVAYVVRGHFIRSLHGQEAEVSRRAWIYSYLHSISMFVTSAAMIISMLVLARPHIVATMRDGWIGGRTFVIALGVLVGLVTAVAVVAFALNFANQLAASRG